MANTLARVLQSGQDERNLSRLSLILASKRVPDDLQSWVKEFPSEDAVGTTMRIECSAGHNNVVPHGIDNDILLGLVNAYVEAGMPKDGTFYVGAYRLLQLSGIQSSGKRYATLEESLARLQTTTYKITDSWYDNARSIKRSITTSLVQKYVLLDESELPENLKSVRAESMLSITLDSDLTKSVRSGFIRHLDLDFLRQLQQPLVRLLYRLLSELSHPINEPPNMSYQVSLMAWAKHLGLLDDRAFRVRRALEPAHVQLIELGFLKSVDYRGRGESQEVLYVFTDKALPAADNQTVALLIEFGISSGEARKYAAMYGKKAIEERVAVFKDLLASGYKANKQAALLIDVIRNPAKYPATNVSVIPAKKRAMAVAVAEEPEEQERSLKTAKFLIGNTKLSDLERSQVTELYMQGLVSAWDLTQLQTDSNPQKTVLLWCARHHDSSF